MDLFGKLKAIGIQIPKLKTLISIKFGSLIHIDKSIHIEGSSLTIDPSRLNGKQRRGLKEIMPDLLGESGAIIEETNEPIVEGVLKALPSKEEVSKKLAPIIPSGDIPLMHACLFLRRRSQMGEPVDDLKLQIVRSYGPRGRNFSNLCTAGYLETWFCPLYDSLLSANTDEPEVAKAQFQVNYNRILNELPWTEFVSAYQSAAKITAHIVEKMKRNIANGTRHLNVHGLGAKNVKKIESILPEIQKAIKAAPVIVDKTPTRIFVRLEVPPEVVGG